MIKSRDEQISEITRRLMQGGWSSVYAFVDEHIEDWELDNDEDNDEEDE